MTRFIRLGRPLKQLVYTLLTLLVDGVRGLALCLRPSPMLATEILFLRKQSAVYQERRLKPQRATAATRCTLVWLGHWFGWRQALAVVQPATFTCWHRRSFRLFWQWESRPGRRPIPADLQVLIGRRAWENPT
jgi:hypothetical protein